ncbi:stage II sporulation protein R [Salinithrix halophila]|uniref:Stage II sporulation protein R n=1 Tax=Salinithrix halophila TaxID=1485204 RepID=A0ABV8JHE4_9BACL
MKVRTIIVLILCSAATYLFVQSADTDGFLTGNGAVPVSADSEKASIPEQAIRLRILANSDNARDQWLKRQVRDSILKEMGTWAEKPKSLEEARSMLQADLPKLERIAQQTVKKHGFSYPVRLDFGQVPFPTKLYGDQVYPAGEYEALLITIGEGKGDNWWCVLFPPLCFVDMSNGDAVPEEEKEENTFTAQAVAANQVLAAPVEKKQLPQEDRLEIRFFFLDSLEDFFSGLFDW